MSKYTATDGNGDHKICKGVNSVVQYCIDLGPSLAPGATIASGATVSITSTTEATPTLSASSVSVNGSTFTDQTDSTRTVTTGEGIKFLLSGGTAGVSYDVTVYGTATDGTVPDAVFMVEVH